MPFAVIASIKNSWKCKNTFDKIYIFIMILESNNLKIQKQRMDILTSKLLKTFIAD